MKKRKQDAGTYTFRFKIMLEKAAAQPWSMFQVSCDVFFPLLSKVLSQSFLPSSLFYSFKPPSLLPLLTQTEWFLPLSHEDWEIPLECWVHLAWQVQSSWIITNLCCLVSWENQDCQWSEYQTTFSDNVCALQLNSLDSSDMGSYTCVAANVAGSDECRAVLAVQGQCKTLTSFLASSSLGGHPCWHIQNLLFIKN